jgi:hypothetical protein
LHREKLQSSSDEVSLEPSDWITPTSLRIKEKRRKTISPYGETEIRG